MIGYVMPLILPPIMGKEGVSAARGDVEAGVGIEPAYTALQAAA